MLPASAPRAARARCWRAISGVEGARELVELRIAGAEAQAPLCLGRHVGVEAGRRAHVARDLSPLAPLGLELVAGLLGHELPAGAYSVAEVVQAGWVNTAPVPIGPQAVTLGAGQTVPLSFGNVKISSPSPTTAPTPSPTATPSPTPRPTLAPTPSPTLAPSPSVTPQPTPTPTPAPTPSPTPSPTITPAPKPTPAPTPSPSPPGAA